MAQKQFKIGLSNTDKQNMAQDVYERLLALTFPEYETTESYEIGDFVVYNDQLYKCIGATSGAWDSTKWQLATLNDLLTDIESAVAFVNDKANVDGNYPTMTVGMADNLTPYDESAGDDQDEPFILQATGTGNGTQPDFATGSAGLMKEKQGNTVVVNQLFDSANAGRTHCTVSNGLFTVSAAGSVTASVTKTAIQGHKYMLISKYNMVLNGEGIYTIAIGLNGQHKQIIGSQNQSKSGLFMDIVEKNDTFSGTAFAFYALVDPGTTDLTGSTFTCNIIDLTQWFNGDIPQDLLDNPENFFRYYQGSLAYNEGALVNANGRYIKCIGMNQWDEEWELGRYDWTNGTGEKVASNTQIRSKNYIPAIPNTTYHFTGSEAYILFYDANKEYISYAYVSSTTNATTPSNCAYMTFYCFNTYGTTYNNDISINIYYEDEPRCLTYEPYEVLTNNDTGTEVLRSAGSVKDSKAPDGTITRRVGYVDLGTLNWEYQSSEELRRFVSDVLTQNAKLPSSDNVRVNALCSKYSIEAVNALNTQLDKIGIGVSTNNRIYLRDTNYTNAAALKASLSGVYLFYELAEPTTEQGAPYSENLVIDDFGSMDFGGTSGVPQGALIFYPVDYKAFVDTLYKYTDGTPSDIALKSDLPTAPQSWAESLPGYDATKTQTLKNVEGTLTWVDDE